MVNAGSTWDTQQVAVRDMDHLTLPSPALPPLKHLSNHVPTSNFNCWFFRYVLGKTQINCTVDLPRHERKGSRTLYNQAQTDHSLIQAEEANSERQIETSLSLIVGYAVVRTSLHYTTRAPRTFVKTSMRDFNVFHIIGIFAEKPTASHSRGESDWRDGVSPGETLNVLFFVLMKHDPGGDFSRSKVRVLFSLGFPEPWSTRKNYLILYIDVQVAQWATI
ncbi:hypothetical protein BJY00DRAFT_316298 [Aspergillus carlsbadensis]|nr:hypothetical protein BJY00DRAFT_316298 [Aspergillus carlsbadensis]